MFGGQLPLKLSNNSHGEESVVVKVICCRPQKIRPVPSKWILQQQISQLLFGGFDTKYLSGYLAEWYFKEVPC